jgi:hypothetical protein
MWWKLKFFLSGVVLLVTMIWMIEDLSNHLWSQALETLAEGILVALLTAAINERNAPWLVMPIAGVFSVAGWLHVAEESPALNLERQHASQALFEAFSNALIAPGFSQAEQNLIWTGMVDCATQPTRDQLATTTEAMKARYETPLMSMVDRASSTGNAAPSPDQCIEAYRELRPQIPGLFVQAEKQSPWLLQQLQPQ